MDNRGFTFEDLLVNLRPIGLWQKVKRVVRGQVEAATKLHLHPQFTALLVWILEWSEWAWAWAWEWEWEWEWEEK
jgi:hypothetical protein